VRIAVALLAGLGALTLLFPASGFSTNPPDCYSAFGYSVPCEPAVSVAAALATAGAVFVLLRAVGRRKQVD